MCQEVSCVGKSVNASGSQSMRREVIQCVGKSVNASGSQPLRREVSQCVGRRHMPAITKTPFFRFEHLTQPVQSNPRCNYKQTQLI